MKKKVYIIFTYGISVIGGNQMFAAGKAKYLKEKGWTVHVCSPGAGEKNCTIPSLNEYLAISGNWGFLDIPPYKLKKYEQEQLLNFMVQKLNLNDTKNCEIIIESHYDVIAYWAELFAYRVRGRHFFITCNEVYRNIPSKFYEDNLDFFYFKWKRNELVGSEYTLTRLFNGYKNIIKPLIDMPNTIREQDAVQDVEVSNIDDIPKMDWNICHIGRAVKDYVPYAIIGVGELARRHPDKKIHFMMVGDPTSRMELLNKVFGGLKNVKLSLFGDLVPIPRVLFSKIDVVIGISQSAIFAANEDVLTVIANADDPSKTPGVYGYDTTDSVWGKDNKNLTYVEILENIFVKHLYDDKKYSLPKLLPAEHYYEKFWDIVKQADPKKEYYVERLSQERIRNWVAIFPFGIIPKGLKIIIYGATDIWKDYVKQVEGQKYCQILATVDEHSEEFDNTVDSLDRLKTIDYDAIVIATFQQNAQAAYNKILQIVPQMQGRIVYNLQVVSN